MYTYIYKYIYTHTYLSLSPCVPSVTVPSLQRPRAHVPQKQKRSSRMPPQTKLNGSLRPRHPRRPEQKRQRHAATTLDAPLLGLKGPFLDPQNGPTSPKRAQQATTFYILFGVQVDLPSLGSPCGTTRTHLLASLSKLGPFLLS